MATSVQLSFVLHAALEQSDRIYITDSELFHIV